MSRKSVVLPHSVLRASPVRYSNTEVVYTQLPYTYPGLTQSVLSPPRSMVPIAQALPIEEVKAAISAVGSAPVPFTTALVIKRLDQSTNSPPTPASAMVPAVGVNGHHVVTPTHMISPPHMTSPTMVMNGAGPNGVHYSVLPGVKGGSRNDYASPPSVGSVISSGRSSPASHASRGSSPSPQRNVGQLDLLAEAAMAVSARKNTQGATKAISKPNARRNSGRRKSLTRPRQSALGTSRSWTPEEDARLVELVARYGAKNWTEIAERFPGRSGKQVRERYINQLDPRLKRSSWTPEEDAAIIGMQSKFGNKWSLMAKVLPGRTDNAIKNRFNSSLRTKPPRRMWMSRRV